MTMALLLKAPKAVLQNISGLVSSVHTLRTAFRSMDDVSGQHMAMQGMRKGAAPPEQSGAVNHSSCVHMQHG